jgi:hypothetical protein
VNFETRKAIYKQIEEERSTKVLVYITGDRRGIETQISTDCIDLFVDFLDQIGPTKKLSLILHTNGGETLAAWRLVNLLRIFCDELEILIPMKSLSAGTLLCIGADRLIMTKQAALGPIDPSVNSPLNPQISIPGNPAARVPVSVENVLGYLSAAKDELQITSEQHASRIVASCGILLDTETGNARAREFWAGREFVSLGIRDDGKERFFISMDYIQKLHVNA